MNRVILMGRLTRDPELRYGKGGQGTAVCRYTLAVDRPIDKNGEKSADYINCVAFGGRGEFANKYFRKGLKVTVAGELRNNNYTGRDGVKKYTLEVFISDQEFAENPIRNAQHQEEDRRRDFAPATDDVPKEWEHPESQVYQGEQRNMYDVEDDLQNEELPF